MAKQINVSIGGVKKSTKVYACIGNVIKQIKKGFAGIDAVVKEFYTSINPVIYDYGTYYNGASFVANSSNLIQTIGSDYIQITYNETQGGYCYITLGTTLDLSDFTKINFEWKIRSVGKDGKYLHVGFNSSTITSSYGTSAALTAHYSNIQTTTVDISALNRSEVSKITLFGDGYWCLQAAFHKVWFS